MDIRERHLDAWILLPLALIAGVIAADLLAGLEESLIATLVLAPLVGSLMLGPRHTALVGLVAVLAAIALGVPGEFFAEAAHLTRVLPVAVAAALSVWAAGLRHGREQALEREHAARLGAERAERSGAQTVAMLDTLLERAPVGFGFVDRDLRYLRVNDALAAMSGRSGDDLVGRTVGQVGPQRSELEGLLRRVVRTGEPALDLEISTGGDGPSTPERHWLVSCYPVSALDGETPGAGLVAVEVTDRKRAETRAAFLAEFTAVLSASLDYEVTLANVARLAVPELADWCVVDMVDTGGRLRRLAVAHEDPKREELVWELERRHPVEHDDRGAPALTVATCESQLLAELDEATLPDAARSEEHLGLLRELGVRSAMVVPLPAGGQALGAMSLLSGDSDRAFDEDDLAFCEELGRRAGGAIENARLYQERSHIARTLQRSLLPPHLPEIPGVEVAARYRAAGEASDVGGDFYDVFPTGPRAWAVVVGDVLGKGAGAAALIGLARHTLRAAALRDEDPVRILTTLNEALYAEGEEESFCTAVYGTVVPAGDSVHVQLTSAGHPLPLILRRDGSVESAGEPGTLLGAVPEVVLHPARVTLGAGDSLVVFTDGVLEARSETGLFGERRLESLLESLPGASAQELAERVHHDTLEFQSGRPRDDLAVLVLRRPADEPPAPVPKAGREPLGADV
ncbi:MAG TPA: SpoIIE family protein phosphatase [Thermoleophilaceae bacterium]|nr:SpoIIE family protein phosphatase [Thermoleophilaceae bacterium]